MFTTRPELQGTFGMVSTSHWLASSAGMAVLELGGNAFDAAAAAGFVMQVVKPHVNGPGSEVPILLYAAGEDRLRVINGQGPAPSSASIDAFHELGLDYVPATGLLSACVPGAFDAWMLLLRDYGRLSLGQVLSYAIEYAGGGYPVTPGITADVLKAEGRFRESWPTSAALYLAGGIPQPGTLFRNPDLAATYARIVRDAEAAGGDRESQIESARNSFYRGFVAEAIDSFISSFGGADLPVDRHRGFLTADDMARYEARWEEPVAADYHGYTVFKNGPSTQGPVFLQQLMLLAGYDLEAMGHNSVEYIHTIVECAKLAFADREAWYGDTAFVDVPMADLLSADYADDRRKLVGETASGEYRPGTVNGRPPYVGPINTPGRSTAHIAIVDREGNMVSASPSGGLMQFSPTIPGVGFSLSERGQAFYLEPEHPNALVGGKRPRTTLSCSIAFREGVPYMAFGTPGGDRQDQWNLAFFLAHIHFGMNLQEAIDTPLFHSIHHPRSFHPHDGYPRELLVEANMPLAARQGLRKRGHVLVLVDEWTLGWMSAVTRQPDGSMRAGASPREMNAYAVGR
ncbi:MAG TPA: gamma-glutamyltransferase family protein [Gaiellaceae bacterium]|jgi:gamma-glutamyltranspeptidase/glutathione hydrolase|nr:gamma-glutamyltransferase family protein [Gaiellaceae bacterium]